ncbi:class I SAM-dependent methyltransferase [Sporolactobacillus sp. THM19-2]|jgi:tRNA (adenine22-N1)-methyltransferase|uniref:tRNA (adenine(22)-N(1))-methyltransferase n=1 Tax=Sporolactobacillus sp. THM19-2 TaxID=2511171 RepID=UPI001020A2E8|nr:class I SAM-dependent methyltransferase [Sporolactobacillus sp. THM19-2]RYL90413.1 SAM-dependent methyltransferase [Sporolactobacillus sp. THM19-2]
MKDIHLSERLCAVLNFIPDRCVLADIGSDHALLACKAVEDGRAIRAIAGEVRVGPFRRSEEGVRNRGLDEMVCVRLGDGLSVLAPGEADCIVIAGMGGELITDILQRGRDRLNEQTTLILQPNIREPLCRSWLAAHHWAVLDEHIVEEGSHFYEIILAKYAVTGCTELSESECIMGPVLSKKQSPVFIKKWLKREKKLHQILSAIDHSVQKPSPSILMKKRQCVKEMKMIQNCLRRYFKTIKEKQ